METDNKIDLKVLWIVIIFFVFYKFITFRMFDLGGDAVNYWFSAKTLLNGLPYGELTHRTARFGLILPVYLTQLVFGTHPSVTAIVPNILMLIQVIIIYRIGVKIHSVHAGFISAVLFILYPHVVKFSGQILPPAFEGPAVTLSFYFLLLYYENSKKELLNLSLSALMLFWAYTIKETDIYFMPAFLAAIIMFKKNYRHAFIYGTLLFILFLGETGLYYFITGDPLGRLHSITGHHLEGEKLLPMTLLNLTGRYFRAGAFWRVPFIIYMVLVIPLFKKGTVLIKSVLVSGLVFFFLLMISVKSLNPLIPALPFKDQYVMAGFPFMLLIIVTGVIDLLRYILRKRWNLEKAMSVKPYACTISAIALIVLLVTSTGILPEKDKQYYNNIFNISEHKLVRIFRYHNILNKAYAGYTPIVSGNIFTQDKIEKYAQVRKNMDKGMLLDEACKAAGINIRAYTKIRPHMPEKSLNAVSKVFLDISPDMIPENRTTIIDGRLYYYIVKPPAGKSPALLKKKERVLYASTGDLIVTEGEI